MFYATILIVYVTYLRLLIIEEKMVELETFYYLIDLSSETKTMCVCIHMYIHTYTDTHT